MAYALKCRPMDVNGILSVVAVAVAVFAVVFGAGTALRKVPQDVLKYTNWVAFGIAIVSGLVAFNFDKPYCRYVFLASLVVYFLTIGYKKEQS